MVIFHDFMHNDVKQTDKLCFSLKLSAVNVTVAMICFSNTIQYNKINIFPFARFKWFLKFKH